MSLALLTDVKTHLGISGSTEDTALTAYLRAASALVRNNLGSYIAGLISVNTLANPTVCTSPGHGLETGDVITISGSNSTPMIDGERTVTRLTDDTFTVPVNVTVAGTAGVYSPKITEYYAGTGDRRLVLNQRPVQSIASVYEDPGAYYGDASGAFAATTLLTSGTDYALMRDGGSVGASGILVKINGVWAPAGERLRGLLAQGVGPGVGNIKVTYTPGYARPPADIQLAVWKIVGELRQAAGKADLSSESLDYYSYNRMSAAEAAAMLGSVTSLLAPYRRWVI